MREGPQETTDKNRLAILSRILNLFWPFLWLERRTLEIVAISSLCWLLIMSDDGSRSAGDQLRLAASLLGASGVTLGAFGAHALKNKLTAGGKMDNWKTAVMYQLFHAVAVLSVSVLCDQHSGTAPKQQESASAVASYQKAGQYMAVGSVLFSGSIYMLCLEVGPKKLLGPTTPIGGLFMIAGWAMLGLKK